MQTLSERKKIEDPTLYSLKETHYRFRLNYIESKMMEKRCHAKLMTKINLKQH